MPAFLNVVASGSGVQKKVRTVPDYMRSCSKEEEEEEKELMVEVVAAAVVVVMVVVRERERWRETNSSNLGPSNQDLGNMRAHITSWECGYGMLGEVERICEPRVSHGELLGTDDALGQRTEKKAGIPSKDLSPGLSASEHLLC